MHSSVPSQIPISASPAIHEVVLKTIKNIVTLRPLPHIAHTRIVSNTVEARIQKWRKPGRFDVFTFCYVHGEVDGPCGTMVLSCEQGAYNNEIPTCHKSLRNETPFLAETWLKIILLAVLAGRHRSRSEQPS